MGVESIRSGPGPKHGTMLLAGMNAQIGSEKAATRRGVGPAPQEGRGKHFHPIGERGLSAVLDQVLDHLGPPRPHPAPLIALIV